MPAGVKNLPSTAKPSKRSYTALPNLHQICFTPPKTAIKRRSASSVPQLKQTTLTQKDLIGPIEILDSEDDNLLDNEESKRPLRATLSTTKATARTSSSGSKLMDRTSGTKRRAGASPELRSKGSKLLKRENDLVAMVAEDTTLDREATTVERVSNKHSRLATLLTTPTPQPTSIAKSILPKVAERGNAGFQPRTPKHQLCKMVRSSESPENSPESLRKSHVPTQLAGLGQTRRSPRLIRIPLGALSPNLTRRLNPEDRTNHYVKQEPLSQSVIDIQLPPVRTQFDDDDLDARPLRSSPSQANPNHIASDIPWYTRSTPTKEAVDEHITVTHPPASSPGLPKRRSTISTIADSDAEGDEDLFTQLQADTKELVTVQASQRHAPRSGVKVVSSTATTQAASSTPLVPPLDQASSPLLSKAPLPSFSQATTADETPRSQTQDARRLLRSSQAEQPSHPLSDPPLVPSSPPMRVPQRVYRDVPGFGDVAVLTESQMLPESIMDFRLPIPSDVIVPSSQDDEV